VTRQLLLLLLLPPPPPLLLLLLLLLHISPYPQIIKIFISAIAVVFVFAQQPPSVLPSIIQRDEIFCSLGASQTSITSPLTLHLFERGLGL
jgi:hypothetical protein